MSRDMMSQQKGGQENFYDSRGISYLFPGENEHALLEIMENERVTLPTARNILKMRKLGIAGSGAPKRPEALPGPHPDKLPMPLRKGPPARLLQAEKARIGSGAESSGAKMTAAEAFGFAPSAKAKPKASMSMKTTSLISLKPITTVSQPINTEAKKSDIGNLDAVDSRSEVLQRAAAASVSRNDDDEDELPQRTEAPKSPDLETKRAMIQAAYQAEEARKKQVKLDERRKGLNAAFAGAKQGGGEKANQKQSKRARSASKSRSESGNEAEGDRRMHEGQIMSEAQIVAMMRKQKKGGGTARGSTSAQTRIQREMAEWESAKQQNPEYWRAPKFARVLEGPRSAGNRNRG